MILSRLWIRQLVKLVIGLFILCGALLAIDLYVNFLPPVVHSRLPMHIHTPIVTDIKIVQCMKVGKCLPSGQDGWYQHPKELSLKKAWLSNTYLYTRRIQDEDLDSSTQVVLDVAIASAEGGVPLEVVVDINGEELISGNTGSPTSSKATEKAIREQAAKFGWVEQDVEVGLWVKYGRYHSSKSVTSVKVLFGADAVYPLPGWKLIDGALRIGAARIPPRLAIRIGPKRTVDKPVLQIKNQRFKIAQLTDLHMVAGKGDCYDPEPPLKDGEVCLADQRTADYVRDILDEEKPDFIVYTGDMIYGDTSEDPETALLKALAPAIERQIPWAAIFGNHDGERPGNNDELMQIMEDLPYSLARTGPESAAGVGNYMLTAQVNGHPALAMYFLDTHSKKNKFEYDYVRTSQIEYMRELHQSIVPQQADYAHIPIGMAFIHIPLPEYRNVNNPMVGKQREAVIAPKKDDGARALLSEIGVSVVTAGHDHCNDYCVLNGGDVWLCYGGAVGEGGYGGYPDETGANYRRRIRMFEVDTQGSSVTSYKLVRGLPGQLDRQILVKDGKAYNENSQSAHHSDAVEAKVE